jgi:hypothetical protein
MNQPAPSRRRGGAVRAAVALLLVGAVAATGALTTGAAPAAASDRATSAGTTVAAHRTGANSGRCVSIRPESDFYEGGRIGSEELITPTSRCTTISVSHIQDPANPADRCQTFLLGFWPFVDGSLTYTEPVTACGPHRTVLARDVPDGARYIVIYAIDYLEPVMQHVEFRLWH